MGVAGCTIHVTPRFELHLIVEKFAMLTGRNAVEEAIDQYVSIEKIFLARSIKGPFEKYIRQSCRERSIPLSYVEKAKLDKLSRSNHQGVIAYITPINYNTLDNLIPHLIETKGNPLVVLLDGVTDVRNVGAIARSAEILGAHALILPTDGSALINEFAMKTSAGALFHLPIARTHSLINAADLLIGSGFELIALDVTGSENITSWENNEAPVAVIMGDEELGVRKPLLKKCHHIYRIPQLGQTESLNVSVATGITLYELMIKRSNETR